MEAYSARNPWLPIHSQTTNAGSTFVTCTNHGKFRNKVSYVDTRADNFKDNLSGGTLDDLQYVIDHDAVYSFEGPWFRQPRKRTPQDPPNTVITSFQLTEKIMSLVAW